jgi:hypothetical protein
MTLALAVSRPLNSKLIFTYEAWGATELNSANPALASDMAAVTYTISKRMVFNAGIDLGLTPAAPRARLAAGCTYSLGNINSFIKKKL